MKDIKNFINEDAGRKYGAFKRKYSINNNIKSNIIVFDRDNSAIINNFKDIKGAEKYANDFNNLTKTAGRFVVIDFDNLTPEMQDVIDTYEITINNN